jgi:transposase
LRDDRVAINQRAVDKRLERERDPEILRAANRLLEAENTRLTKLNLALKNELAASKGHEVQSLQAQIAELEQQLAVRNKALFGDSSERRPSQDDKPGADAADKAPQTGHGPRQQSLDHVERVHELDDADKTCTACGGELSEWDGQSEDSDEVDHIERRYVIVKHKRKKYRCGCGGCIETAPGPLKLMAGGRYSLDFAIGVVMAKYFEHMPLERQVRTMNRLGLTTDSQTLWDQINALAKILSPLHVQLQNAVLARGVIGADETHWKLLSESSKSGNSSKRWQVWAIVSDSHVCYRIQDGRGLEQAEALLDGYRGVVMCDGYAVYSALSKKHKGLLLAHCWAHVRRKFVEVDEHEPGRCTEVLDLIGKLFDVERRARDGNLDEAALLALRRAESKPIVDAIQAWAIEQRALPTSALGKAIAYMHSVWPGLRVFLDNAVVPVDNNATERALRGVVLGRKNHYGSKSIRGTEVAALFYSIIETCKLQGLDPAKYLRTAAEAALKGEPIPLPTAE